MINSFTYWLRLSLCQGYAGSWHGELNISSLVGRHKSMSTAIGLTGFWALRRVWHWVPRGESREQGTLCGEARKASWCRHVPGKRRCLWVGRRPARRGKQLPKLSEDTSYLRPQTCQSGQTIGCRCESRDKRLCNGRTVLLCKSLGFQMNKGPQEMNLF